MRIIRILTATVATATVIGGVPAAQVSVPAKKPPAPTFTTTIKAGRQAAREALKQTNATSVSVALVANGKRVWSQTFGRVNTAGEKPSPTTKYGIGSVSKTVTAIALMQLVDAGKVSLDAPVVRYVPDFTMKSPQYRQITVRMLLNHSAGFPGSDYADGLTTKPFPGYVDGVLAGLRNSYLKTTPGSMNVYCNDCYTLAGVVLERVSGMSLPDYVAKNIFKPLGMKHSIYPTSLPVPGKVAPVIQGGKVQPFQVPNLFATGALLSTANDMARLAMIFTGDGVVDGKRILSSSAIDQMSADQTTTTLEAAPPGAFRYGLGWDSVQDPALNSAGVRGWTKGGDLFEFHAGFVIAPDQGLAAIVEGAGTSFSSTAAQTIAQTMLLNALVENGDIKKLPKQISGKPDKERATRQTGQQRDWDLPGPERQRQGDGGQGEVAAAVDPVRRRMGAPAGSSRSSGERGLLVDRHVWIVDQGGQGLGSKVPDPAHHGRHGNLPHPRHSGPTRAVGRSDLTGLAGSCGQQVVAGQ